MNRIETACQPSPNIHLIGQQQAKQFPNFGIGIVPHAAPCDLPIFVEVPSHDASTGQPIIAKHVWGGKSKRLAIAADLVAARMAGLDIDDAGQIEAICRLGLKVADTLIALESPTPPAAAAESSGDAPVPPGS